MIFNGLNIWHMYFQILEWQAMQKSYQVGIWELFLSFGKAVYFIPNNNEWQREFSVEGEQMEAENKETSEVRGGDWRR